MADKKVTVAKLADLAGGELVGDGEVIVSDFNSLEAAKKEEISFLANAKNADQLETTDAGAVIVPVSFDKECSFPLIKVKNPYLAVAKIHTFLLEKDFVSEGIHASAYVGNDCTLAAQITVKPKAVIGDNVTIGERTIICSGVVVGNNVVIGSDCMIRPNVTIEDGTEIGDRVVIHGGTVIGSSGFGYATDEMGVHHARPQVGVVKIGNDVEIGSNCSIDRAAYGVTCIKDGVKIDNQVQVAHNVVIGEHSLIVAQAGLAGSTEVGRNVVMGGKTAAAGHQKIGDGCMIAGGSGIVGDLKAGSVVGGRPSMPLKQWRKSVVVYSKLPEMHKDIKELKKEISKLKNDEK